MAPVVFWGVQGAAAAGRWAVGRAVSWGATRVAGQAAGRAAVSQIRRHAETESPTKTKEDTDACSTCRDPRCEELERQMRQVIERRRGQDGVANRGLREQAENLVNPKKPLSELEKPGGGRGQKPGGHHKAWTDAQNSINNKRSMWEELGCGPFPADIDRWATMDPPQPGGVIPP